MPNPFVKGGPANTSREVDREPLEPVPDHIEGDVLPYRGYTYHGVMPNVRPAPPEGYSDVVDVQYDAHAVPEESVPVRIVNTGSRQIRMFRTFRELADPTKPPRRILGVDPQRTKGTIKNMSAEEVWLGGTPGEASIIHGYVLRQYEVYECEADQEVYAQSSHVANVVTLCVAVEFTTDLD